MIRLLIVELGNGSSNSLHYRVSKLASEQCSSRTAEERGEGALAVSTGSPIAKGVLCECSRWVT